MRDDLRVKLVHEECDSVWQCGNYLLRQSRGEGGDRNKVVTCPGSPGDADAGKR